MVEILVCVVIVALLAALLLPALVSARRQSMAADETSRLRQMGIAFALYEDQYSKRHYDPAPFVALSLMPATLLDSPLDPTERGYANVVAKDIHESLPHMDYEVPYRSSFPSFLTYGQFNETYAKKIEGRPFAGWAISISSCRPAPGSFISFVDTCRYQRLLLDGAVVRRSASGMTLDDQSQGFSPYTFFADFSEQEFRELFYVP